MACSMNVLVWLKHDLRLHDHPALTLAAGLGRVLPVYLIEPDHWHQPDRAARHWAFTAESLAALRAAMAPMGVTLAVRSGDAAELLERLCRRHAITRMVSQAGPVTDRSRARDLRVAGWARTAGVEWTELPAPGLTQPGLVPSGLAPPLPPAPLQGVEGVEAGPIPDARALRLAPDPCPHRQRGGRAEGLQLLDSFLATRGAGYRGALSAPAPAERASSRLSAHLAAGTLSAAEVTAAAAARRAEHPQGGWDGALAGFQARLALRAAALAAPCGLPVAATGRAGDAGLLAAWAAGQTGLPFLDACLRYLAATGWLNQRLRAMVASVGLHQFGLDLPAAGHALARLFTDYEPGLHWPQLQTLAGAARLPDPLAEARRCDPDGGFTRRWLPELAAVPDAHLQAPWRWPGFAALAGRRYPEPVIDPVSATRAARAARHPAAPAPRLPPPRRNAPRGRKPEAQLSLDL